MIVRILSEGQYDFPGAQVGRLNRIDNRLVEAVQAGDREGFERLLKQMLDLVREKGTPLPLEDLVESDLVLPQPDLTFEEAATIFTGEGLLPG